MVLELKAPVCGDSGHGLRRLPALLFYVLSFIYVGIYWNNHHHMLHASHEVTAAILWANLHLLFWLSLFPAPDRVDRPALKELTAPAATRTGWYAWRPRWRSPGVGGGDHPGRGPPPLVATAVGRATKAQASLVHIRGGTELAFVILWITYALYATVSVMWFVPDRRLSRPSGLKGPR